MISDAVIVSIVSGVFTLLTLIVTSWTKIKLEGKMDVIHKQIDGQQDKLLEAVAGKSHAEGKADGKAELKQEIKDDNII